MTQGGVNGDYFHWQTFVAPCKLFTTFISKIWEVKATPGGLGLAVYMIMLQQNLQTILVKFCLQIFILPISFNGLWLIQFMLSQHACCKTHTHIHVDGWASSYGE